MYGVEHNAKAFAQFSGELLVAVALVATEVKIAMYGLAVVSESLQHYKECDRVCSAADGNEYLVALFQQSVLVYVSLNLVSHCAILSRR